MACDVIQLLGCYTRSRDRSSAIPQVPLHGDRLSAGAVGVRDSSAEPTLATTDTAWGQPSTSAAAQLDAKTPKCPTHGLLANPELECKGRHRVAVLVEPDSTVHLFSGKPAYASRRWMPLPSRWA